MESPWDEWESAAAEVLNSTATSVPVDAFALAKACGYEVKPFAGRGAERRGAEIFVNTKLRPQRQHMLVAHELGHHALERHEIEDSEWGAKWAGGAMMLPRPDFSRHLTRTAWCLAKLQAIHVNASATAIAVRITQVRTAAATILDPCGRRRSWRVVSPWVQDRSVRRVSPWEIDLAEQAYEAREEVRGDELCYAVPLIDSDDPDEHRVLVVCEVEQLTRRL